jgi:hypothetical protein
VDSRAGKNTGKRVACTAALNKIQSDEAPVQPINRRAGVQPCRGDESDGPGVQRGPVSAGEDGAGAA